MRAVDIACLLVLNAPGRNVDVVGILGVNGNVIKNVVIAAEMRQPRPTMSPVGREEKSSGTAAEVNTVGIVRVRTQTPNVSSFRTQSGPLSGPKTGYRRHYNKQHNQWFTGNPQNRTRNHR